MLTATQKMQFYLRMAYGNSCNSYGAEGDVPFQGTCQGNGASPAVWLVVLAILLKLLDQKGAGTIFWSAMLMQALSLVAIMFVDDTNLILMGKLKQDDERVVVARL